MRFGLVDAFGFVVEWCRQGGCGRAPVLAAVAFLPGLVCTHEQQRWLGRQTAVLERLQGGAGQGPLAAWPGQKSPGSGLRAHACCLDVLPGTHMCYYPGAPHLACGCRRAPARPALTRAHAHAHRVCLAAGGTPSSPSLSRSASSSQRCCSPATTRARWGEGWGACAHISTWVACSPPLTGYNARKVCVYVWRGGVRGEGVGWMHACMRMWHA